jgi:N-acyl-D-aspartate/D-glutamate deacylase
MRLPWPYPYTAGFAPLKTLLPPWVLSQGFGDFSILARRRDAIVKDMAQDDWDNIYLLCGAERIVVSSARGYNQYEGRSLAGIAGRGGGEPFDAIAEVGVSSRFGNLRTLSRKWLSLEALLRQKLDSLFS